MAQARNPKGYPLRRANSQFFDLDRVPPPNQANGPRLYPPYYNDGMMTGIKSAAYAGERCVDPAIALGQLSVDHQGMPSPDGSGTFVKLPAHVDRFLTHPRDTVTRHLYGQIRVRRNSAPAEGSLPAVAKMLRRSPLVQANTVLHNPDALWEKGIIEGYRVQAKSNPTFSKRFDVGAQTQQHYDREFMMGYGGSQISTPTDRTRMSLIEVWRRPCYDEKVIPLTLGGALIVDMMEDMTNILDLLDYMILHGRWGADHRSQSHKRSLPVLLECFKTRWHDRYQACMAEHEASHRVEHLLMSAAKSQRANFRKKLETRYAQQIAEARIKQSELNRKQAKELEEKRHRGREAEEKLKQAKKVEVGKEQGVQNHKQRVDPAERNAPAQTSKELNEQEANTGDGDKPSKAKLKKQRQAENKRALRAIRQEEEALLAAASQPTALSCIRRGENWPNNEKRKWYSLYDSDGSECGVVRPAFCDVKAREFFNPSAIEQLVHQVLLDTSLPSKSSTYLMIKKEVEDLRNRLTRGNDAAQRQLGTTLKEHPDLIKPPDKPQSVDRIMHELAVLLCFADPQFHKATLSDFVPSYIAKVNWTNNARPNRVWYTVRVPGESGMAFVYPAYADDKALALFNPSPSEKYVHYFLLREKLPALRDEHPLSPEDLTRLVNQLTGCNDLGTAPKIVREVQQGLRKAYKEYPYLRDNVNNVGDFLKGLAGLLSRVDKDFYKAAGDMHIPAIDRYKRALRHFQDSLKETYSIESKKEGYEPTNPLDPQMQFEGIKVMFTGYNYADLTHLLDDLDPTPHSDSENNTKIINTLIQTRNLYSSKLGPYGILRDVVEIKWPNPRTRKTAARA